MDANYSHKNGTAALERSLMYQVKKGRLFSPLPQVMETGQSFEERNFSWSDALWALMVVNEKLPIRHSQE